ncbi:hypothetical protein DFH06DRAFT_1169319 [Mycena polygramma]|nr:hypothetical protein DFH06DRAFT_1169319 [Mycena polygramma]
MPFPKLFKRRRTTSAFVHAQASDGPSLTASHLSVPQRLGELRGTSSMPHIMIPERAASESVNGGPDIRSNANDPAHDRLQLSIPGDSKVLPPTPNSPHPSPARSEASNDMGGMWRDINVGDGNISKTEKMLNKISDTADGAVGTVSASDGVVGFVKNVMANEEVKAIGNTILEGVPAIMNALETLTEVHPFLKAAYLPFQLIYHQEIQRRENDHKRRTLFEKIKDVMMVLLELKAFKKDDTRTTPEGKPVLSRMATICKDMKKDIEECYNVLNAQEKRSVGIKFLKASAWNRELGSYAARFTTRREDLTFALSMRGVVTMEEMNTNMKEMMAMFSTLLSPQEREMGRWIHQNGGEKVVLGSDTKCAAMIRFEATLATGTTGHADKGRPISDEEARKNEAKAIAALRKEYHEDISGIIQENLETYSKRFEMGLDDLGKDIGHKVQHQGDRLIRYLRGGPQQRIKDKMAYHVWKDQGWKGSAATHPLVLALRDYFVERIEQSKLPPPPEGVVAKRPISVVPSQAEHDDDDDPETDMSVPLPDAWMAAYLQVKRLRYLQQALDPDSSGFTTISELNAFTRARPEDWSFPRWISYWAIGWQIYATKYCVEIEELFAQMMLVRFQIGLRMPGNKTYVTNYIEDAWQHVTALTSAIERDDSPPSWLEEKFSGYVKSQEAIFKERLEKIHYDIDGFETIALVLRGERPEWSVLVLIALLMRRHLAKMHLALKQELDSRELWDDSDMITWVADALWDRFKELKDQLQHQGVTDLKRVFEGLSCGLFKNYWEWQDWVQPKYFKEHDLNTWGSVDTIRELDPSELKQDILVYGDPTKPAAEPESKEVSSDATSAPSSVEPSVSEAAGAAGRIASVEVVLSNSQVAPSTLPLSKPAAPETTISGTWYGWHWTDTRKPWRGMTSINFKCAAKQADSETETPISGDGAAYSGVAFTLTGTLDSADQIAGSLAISFERIYTDGNSIQYKGTFQPDRDMMTGMFKHSTTSGEFLFKKVPSSPIMCIRPMIAHLGVRQLWSFALNAVVNRIRRKKLDMGYVCERMTSMHRILGFMDREKHGVLDDVGHGEYSKLLSTFSFEEMAELSKLWAWYNRAANLHPAFYICDICRTAIVRTRVVCLDCVGDSSVDFCSKPECLAARIPGRTDVKHIPSHTMTLFRDMFLLKDYYATKKQSQASLETAREMYRDPKPTLTSGLTASPIAATHIDEVPVSAEEISLSPIGEDGLEEDRFNCAFCHERVVTPCWYCTICSNAWVCDACEKTINNLLPWDFQKRYWTEMGTRTATTDDPQRHTVLHTMVRVARAGDEGDKADENDAVVTGSTGDISAPGQWEQIEKRIQELVTAAVNSHTDKRLDEVEARLTNIERLLSIIVARE